MTAVSDFFNSSIDLIFSNLDRIIFSLLAVVLVYVVYTVLTRQLNALKKQQKLEENVAFTLKRISQWIAILVILAIGFSLFGVQVGLIAGLFALAGGTIIGFAAMNTLGNAIAGIIVMISRPFKIGDRICFKDQFADIEAINLIYTRMRTLDNVLVSIPNQELLKSEIENYGKKRDVRRSCSILAGYGVPAEQVETALIEAANKVDGVMKNPKPYVWITNLGDFAVEYTLYIFVKQIKRLPEIDAELKKSVLETAKLHGIDLSTPQIFRRV